MAQLVEQLLPTPEVCSLNPDIGKNLFWTFTVNFSEKMTIKKKRPEMAYFQKNDNTTIHKNVFELTCDLSFTNDCFNEK